MEILLGDRSPRPYTTFPFHTHGYWEIILGLEVHAQVVSESKLFSGAVPPQARKNASRSTA